MKEAKEEDGQNKSRTDRMGSELRRKGRKGRQAGTQAAKQASRQTGRQAGSQ